MNEPAMKETVSRQGTHRRRASKLAQLIVSSLNCEVQAAG